MKHFLTLSLISITSLFLSGCDTAPAPTTIEMFIKNGITLSGHDSSTCSKQQFEPLEKYLQNTENQTTFFKMLAEKGITDIRLFADEVIRTSCKKFNLKHDLPFLGEDIYISEKCDPDTFTRSDESWDFNEIMPVKLRGSYDLIEVKITFNKHTITTEDYLLEKAITSVERQSIKKYNNAGFYPYSLLDSLELKYPITQEGTSSEEITYECGKILTLEELMIEFDGV